MPAASARSGLFNRPRRHWNGQVVHQNLSTRWLRSDKARRGSPGVTIYWACRDDIVAPQADDRVDSGRDRGTAAAGAGRAGNDSTASGLPVPRFVSLKTDRVNVRGGPDKDHDVAWIYTKVGLPVEITAEFENWRRIRDSDGTEGWVYHSLLSGKRTATVQLKSKTDLAPIYT